LRNDKRDLFDHICSIEAVAPSDFLLLGTVYKLTLLLLLLLILLLLYMLCKSPGKRDTFYAVIRAEMLKESRR